MISVEETAKPEPTPEKLKSGAGASEAPGTNQRNMRNKFMAVPST